MWHLILMCISQLLAMYFLYGQHLFGFHLFWIFYLIPHKISSEKIIIQQLIHCCILPMCHLPSDLRASVCVCVCVCVQMENFKANLSFLFLNLYWFYSGFFFNLREISSIYIFDKYSVTFYFTFLPVYFFMLFFFIHSSKSISKVLTIRQENILQTWHKAIVNKT